MALLEVFADVSSTTVSSGGTGSPAPASGTVESWTVVSSASFPAVKQGATQFHVADPALPGELIAVTAISGTTWTVTRGADSTTPVPHSAGFTVTAVVTAPVLQAMQYKPWQFPVKAYGARCDGRIVNDGAMTSASNVLTTPGLPAPSTPTVNHAGTGGTVAAGTYQVEVTYVNPFGETLASSAASVTTTGTTSTITVTSPAAMAGDATGYYVYCTQAGGSTFFRQQPAGQPTQLYPIATIVNYVISAPPTTTGANPPGANTTQSNPFTASDVGKTVMVWFHGAGTGTWLETTITAFTNSGQVTLGATAGATVSTAGVVWGSDDTAACQAAVNAAVAYGLKGNGNMGEVLWDAGICMLATAATPGGANSIQGNAQIYLPFITQQQNTVRIALKGAGAQEFATFAQPTIPQAGTILLSTRTDAANDSTNGYSTVIGGPYAIDEPNSNMHVLLDGICVMVPPNGTTPTPYAGADFLALDNATVGTFSYQPLALFGQAEGTELVNSITWPYMSGGYDGHLPANSFGLRMPIVANEAICQADKVYVAWAQYGLFGIEHFIVNNLLTQYCFGGWTPGPAGHGGAIMRWTCQLTTYPIYNPNIAWPVSNVLPCKVFIGMLDLETPSNIVNDPNGQVFGECRFEWQAFDPNHYFGNQIVNGGQIPGIKLIAAGTRPGPVSSPQAAPATTVAWNNYYYHDAEITASVSAGTLSALTIDGVTQTIPASTTFYRFTLPSGHSYTPTYTGTLTHTVTLL